MARSSSKVNHKYAVLKSSAVLVDLIFASTKSLACGNFVLHANSRRTCPVENGVPATAPTPLYFRHGCNDLPRPLQLPLLFSCCSVTQRLICASTEREQPWLVPCAVGPSSSSSGVVVSFVGGQQQCNNHEQTSKRANEQTSKRATAQRTAPRQNKPPTTPVMLLLRGSKSSVHAVNSMIRFTVGNSDVFRSPNSQPAGILRQQSTTA